MQEAGDWTMDWVERERLDQEQVSSERGGETARTGRDLARILLMSLCLVLNKNARSAVVGRGGIAKSLRAQCARRRT